MLTASTRRLTGATALRRGNTTIPAATFISQCRITTSSLLVNHHSSLIHYGRTTRQLPCHRQISPSHHHQCLRFSHTSTSSSGRKPSDKIYKTVEEALDASGLKNGDTVLAGGFGVCGIPMALIQGIQRRGTKDLIMVSNDCGVDDWGLGILLHTKQIKRMVASYVGENKLLGQMYLRGELELELTPQGTLAEKMRAGGAGIPAFYTPASYGTIAAEGKMIIKYNKDGTPAIVSEPKPVSKFGKEGKAYVLEESIVGDVGIIKATKADTYGNLYFNGTSRNFNPECGQGGRFTIAEVEEIVPAGSLKPEDIHLPGIYVHAIVQANVEKRITKLTVEKPNHNNDIHQQHKIPAEGSTPDSNSTPAQSIRDKIARRAAQELKDGMSVNLGIGMPTLVSNYIPDGMQVTLQSENGLLGMGPYPPEGKADPDLINAGKETITTLPHSSIFSSSQSFAMIRGRKVGLTILGAMEVGQHGSLANWIIPGKMVKGMGGAMDLVSSGTRVVVTMQHCDKAGNPKILSECKLPLTGYHVVNRIITELAVFDVDHDKGLTLIEKASEVTVDRLRELTDAPFRDFTQSKRY